MIGEAATKGNRTALGAVAACIRYQMLSPMASQAFGPLAANGSEGILEILLNPQSYDIPLSQTVVALCPAAKNGNQRAIEALSAVAKDTDNEGLRFAAALGLAQAAETGNAVAIDTLISLLPSTNENVRNSSVRGLKRAATNQNAKAIEALRVIGAQ